MKAVDILSVQKVLRDRLPATSQEAIERIATQLSDKPKTAGSCMIAEKMNNGHKETVDALSCNSLP